MLNLGVMEAGHDEAVQDGNDSVKMAGEGGMKGSA